jgi:toxin-antitoxin system PIN domain toxin
VIAVDTNLLVYAFREDSEFHVQAAVSLGRLAQGREAWAILWPCAHEFLSVVTNKRIYKTAAPMSMALDAMDAWMESPSLSLLCESGRHWLRLRNLLTTGQIAGPMVHDARIAALCLQHGVRELWTADRDFGRFPALKTVNPLVAG